MHGACSSNASTPDATTADAAIGGLVIELVAKGGVPQMPDADVEITRVTLGARALRAIGDAAPGDMRTTRDHYEFVWPGDSTIPIPILFPDAPPGLYSRIELRVADSSLGGVADAVNIIGRARKGGNLVPFEIKNMTADIPVTVTVETVLAPRVIAMTTIEVDVAALVDDVDWDAVPVGPGGVLFIGDSDPEMVEVTKDIATSFTAP